MGAGVVERRSGVRPGGVGEHAVAALGLGSADRDDVQPVGAGLEGAHDRWRDADDVPLADLADLVGEPDAPRAGDDHVGLLLLPLAVATELAQVRLEGEAPDPDHRGAEVLACEASLEAGEPVANGVLDVEQVHDRVVGHARMLDPPPEPKVTGCDTLLLSPTADAARGSLADRRGPGAAVTPSTC